jgi:hypothetical protein
VRDISEFVHKRLPPFSNNSEFITKPLSALSVENVDQFFIFFVVVSDKLTARSDNFGVYVRKF